MKSYQEALEYLYCQAMLNEANEAHRKYGDRIPHDTNIKSFVALCTIEELIVMHTVFKELYDEYVTNEKCDTLTDGTKQLSYALQKIYDGMKLAIEIRRLEK